jgi:hypothetical protein
MDFSGRKSQLITNNIIQRTMKKETPQQRFDKAFAMLEYLIAREDTPCKNNMIDKLKKLMTPYLFDRNITIKDATIIVDAQQKRIPIFVLAAKDENSVAALYEYLGKCEETNCDQEHINNVYDRYSEFVEWQLKNKDLVKLPD